MRVEEIIKSHPGFKWVPVVIKGPLVATYTIFRGTLSRYPATYEIIQVPPICSRNFSRYGSRYFSAIVPV